MENKISTGDDHNDRTVTLEQENKRLRRSLEELGILNELATAIGGLGNSENILAKIIQRSVMSVSAEQGNITLVAENSENRKKTLVRTVDTSSQRKPFHLHESIMIWIYRSKRPLLMNDPRNDARFRELQWDESVRSLLCVPLIVKGVLIGVLTVYNKQEPSGFNADDQRLLAIVASQSAQVIENVRLTEREHIMAIEHTKLERKAQQEFSRRLIDSQERERKRIAAELHDSIGQNLLIIKNRAILGLESCAPDTPDRKELESISSISSETIDEVRAISYNLHPYQLDRLGLTKAIQSIINRMKDSSRTQFLFDVTPIDTIFTKEAEINIFRIVQEGVNNAVKHAEASTIILNIKKDQNVVTLSIEDDGKGFNVESTFSISTESEGFGLKGMSERVRILSGTFTVKSSPRKGTTLLISIPYDGVSNG